MRTEKIQQPTLVSLSSHLRMFSIPSGTICSAMFRTNPAPWTAQQPLRGKGPPHGDSNSTTTSTHQQRFGRPSKEATAWLLRTLKRTDWMRSLVETRTRRSYRRRREVPVGRDLTSETHRTEGRRPTLERPLRTMGRRRRTGRTTGSQKN